jgi:hypothetical protein
MENEAQIKSDFFLKIIPNFGQTPLKIFVIPVLSGKSLKNIALMGCQFTTYPGHPDVWAGLGRISRLENTEKTFFHVGCEK